MSTFSTDFLAAQRGNMRFLCLAVALRWVAIAHSLKTDQHGTVRRGDADFIGHHGYALSTDGTGVYEVELHATVRQVR